MEGITGASMHVVVSSSELVVDEGSPSSSAQVVEQGEENRVQGQDESQDQQRQRSRHRHRHRWVSYQLNLSFFPVVPGTVRHETYSAVVVLITFWIFACLTVILGFYGSSDIQLGPNCSRIIKANPFFVQSIQAKGINESIGTLVLYGFHELPPLDVDITWSETHDAIVESGDHKEWQYFLNQGSKIHISYSVKSPKSAALSLVIAQGAENLFEWIEDPSYPNTTLAWYIIHGNGTIEQEIKSSKTHYIALGNLNFEEVEVQLNFTIKALVYNTTQAYYKCSPNHYLCTLKLYLCGTNAAVLTSPGPELGITNHKWYVKLSYGHRWMSYFIASASMTVLILVLIKILSTYQTTRVYGAGFQVRGTGTERDPLLSPKDDDLSSLGSSCESHDEEEFTDSLAGAILDGKQLKEGESNNDHRRLCVQCWDAVRDSFFLPCGHCAACYSCGTRIIEDAGLCPICQRTAKKVRKIFSV